MQCGQHGNEGDLLHFDTRRVLLKYIVFSDISTEISTLMSPGPYRLVIPLVPPEMTGSHCSDSLTSDQYEGTNTQNQPSGFHMHFIVCQLD